jgi:kynurenine formamidase
MRIIDLSATLADNRDWSPWWARTTVKNRGHRFGAWVIRLLFGIPASQLKTGLGWADDVITLSTHATTHVDAPWHYGPECEGKPARTIDQMPLDWFYGNGVRLDLRHLDSDAAASVEDIQTALSKIDYELQPRDIVLIQTGNDEHMGSREYFGRGPGVSAEATLWMLDQGVRLTGIDAWGWDAPLKKLASDAKESGRNDVFWAAHFVGVEKEYCHMERLVNLDSLPATGFRVCAFPLKVKGGSAGPARIVAMIDEMIDETEIESDSS